MLFSGIPFLYYFLPAVLALYFLAPKRGRNVVLLISSLAFYAWGEPRFVLVMLLSILCGYALGLAMAAAKNAGTRKFWMILSVCVSLSFLVYFKYADFFIENFSAATGLSLPLLGVTLPIGISFYTFQIISYTVDVYRGKAEVQKNAVSFATYVALFPQLIAGPIVRYADIAAELRERTSTADDVYAGLGRFIVGLGKKVLIANILGQFCDAFRATGDPSVLFAWTRAVAVSLQIYFDFSGYSDMAIGLGRIFGFHFMENFNYPYISRSVTEFWRRWHISLGSWFRDYVYIPMGGNRVRPLRWVFNILVVWMLTGFWHGASWNFILWGLLFAVLLVAEKIFLGRILEKLPRFISHIYVLFAVVLSFVLFHGDGLAGAAQDVSALFGAGLPFSTSVTLYYLRSYGILFAVAAVGCTPLAARLFGTVTKSKAGTKVVSVLKPVFLLAILALCTAYLVDGSFNPFLYFRF